MTYPTQPPAVDAHGDEHHPAFGRIRVARVHSSPPGVALFDSEIRHSEFVTLSVTRATRKRDLNRDWIHSRHGHPLIEVRLSQAQWAELVSSFNTEGTSCTITATETQHDVPGLPFEPRLALSHAETRQAAHRAFARIKDALDVVEAKPTKANLRALRAAVENAPANVEYAARSLTEHTENVVQKARADVEAMVDSAARARGLSAADFPHLSLDAARDEAPAIEEGTPTP